MKHDYIKTVAIAAIAALALATNAQQAEPCGMKRLGKVKNTDYVISQTNPSSLYLTNFNKVVIQARTTTVSGDIV